MLITMSIVLVATGTTLLFLRQQEQQARSTQFIQHALAQARLVAEYAVSPLVFDDNKGGHELLAKLAQEPNVLYVQISDARGRVFTEVKPPGTTVPRLSLAAG